MQTAVLDKFSQHFLKSDLRKERCCSSSREGTLQQPREDFQSGFGF